MNGLTRESLWEKQAREALERGRERERIERARAYAEGAPGHPESDAS